MSKILSIYNDAAFCEHTLPSAANTELTILLDAELFHLRRSHLLSLECIQGTWHFNCEKDGFAIEILEDAREESAVISENGIYNLITPDKEWLTILSEDQDDSLHVYPKYVLTPGQDITVGLDADNIVCYR